MELTGMVFFISNVRELFISIKFLTLVYIKIDRQLWVYRATSFLMLNLEISICKQLIAKTISLEDLFVLLCRHIISLSPNKITNKKRKQILTDSKENWVNILILIKYYSCKFFKRLQTRKICTMGLFNTLYEMKKWENLYIFFARFTGGKTD